jgi:hypothetical protein
VFLCRRFSAFFKVSLQFEIFSTQFLQKFCKIGIPRLFILTTQLAVSTIRGGKMTIRLKWRNLRLIWFFVLVN